MKNQLNLFCLPYAGGSSNTYTSWTNELESSIKLIPIELKGRGRRFKESLYIDVEDCIEDVYLQIEKYLYQAPFAIFGHSMGGLLTYELAQKLLLNGHRPMHLFISSRKPPHLNSPDKKLSELSNSLFLEEIKTLGGTPKEFFDNKELVDLFLPIIKNDFKIIENHTSNYKEKLPCNTTLICGKEEKIATEMSEWNKGILKTSQVQVFPGDHFYLNEHKKELVKFINHTLLSYSLTQQKVEL